jgi:hypothetical protein
VPPLKAPKPDEKPLLVPKDPDPGAGVVPKAAGVGAGAEELPKDPNSDGLLAELSGWLPPNDIPPNPSPCVDAGSAVFGSSFAVSMASSAGAGLRLIGVSAMSEFP